MRRILICIFSAHYLRNRYLISGVVAREEKGQLSFKFLVVEELSKDLFLVRKFLSRNAKVKAKNPISKKFNGKINICSCPSEYCNKRKCLRENCNFLLCLLLPTHDATAFSYVYWHCTCKTAPLAFLFLFDLA